MKLTCCEYICWDLPDYLPAIVVVCFTEKCNILIVVDVNYHRKLVFNIIINYLYILKIA